MHHNHFPHVVVEPVNLESLGKISVLNKKNLNLKKKKNQFFSKLTPKSISFTLNLTPKLMHV
jgi:hypothetical protein